MSTLEMDSGPTNFAPAQPHPNNNCGEVAIDYSKSCRMSPDEGQQSPQYRVPTKGMRKAYPEDQFVQKTPPPQKYQVPKQSSPFKMDQPHHQQYYSHENTPSPFYPTPPFSDHHQGQHLQQYYQNQNRFNFNLYQDVIEDVREYQCLKCGLIFSCESDLHMHYSHDHGFGSQLGERSSTSSTSSSGGNSRMHHNSSSSSRTSATSQDLFCDKCQLRFHCLLSFRVHQHEHVLPNAHYPMSNSHSHLLSLSYSCEICGASFMARDSLCDHANHHLYEHVCSESTCGGEISDQSTATSSSEDFYNQIHYQNQRNYYQQNIQQSQEDEQNDLHFSQPHEVEEEVDDLIQNQNQGPIYSREYSSSPYPPTQQPPQHEILPPVSTPKLSGGIYEPLIVMDNGKRRFQCVICKKYLSSRIAHEEHTRGKHTGDKPYCCSHCGKRFAVWNTYKHHMSTHKGWLAPPLQKCGLCEKRFKTVECLRNHMHREHNLQEGRSGEEEGSGSGGGTNGGGYSCQICGKTFIRKMWRTRHYLSHGGQNCFRCELCSCILPDEQSYRVHHESHKTN